MPRDEVPGRPTRGFQTAAPRVQAAGRRGCPDRERGHHLLLFVSWLTAAPVEVQALVLAAVIVVAVMVGLDAGRVAWKRTQAELDQVQQALAEERHYKTTLGADLEALSQRLYKRTVEWWAAGLASDRTTAEEKRAVMNEINAKLQAEVSAADAGYFRRPRAYEPFRPNMAVLPDGNWVNEMWHRVGRLDEIVERIPYGPTRRG